MKTLFAIAAFSAFALVAGAAAGQPPGGGEGPAGSDVALNIPGVTAADANAERMIKVIVTGVGVDQAQAKNNALAKAVEQAVGLMVDAQTLISNEDVLKEKVLTYTRGDVKKAVVLKEWEEDDLHHAQVQAEVVASQIAERLRKSSIELRPVPGDLFYHTAKERRRNLRNAAEMLARQVRDFSPATIFRLTPVGEPEVVEQAAEEPPADGSRDLATVKVRYEVQADLPKYMEFRQRMQELLRHMSETRILATCLDDSYEETPFRNLVFSPEKANHMYYRVQKDGADFAYWVFLNQTFVPSDEPNVMRSQWEGYRVAKSLFESFEPLAKQRHRIKVVLLDAAGQSLASSETLLHDQGYDLSSIYHEQNPSWRREMIFLGPFVWKAASYANKPPFHEFTVMLDRDKVEEVKGSQAVIEEAPAP